MSREMLSPITQGSMLYPALSIDRTRPKVKHFICPNCGGNIRTRLQAQIIRKQETVFGFACGDCGKRWYISSKLILNDVFEEQIQKIYKFTKVTKKEFGALLVRTPEGIRLDMVDVGEDLSVTFKRTKEYRKDEEVIGSIHCHPITDIPSDWDIATFLCDDWEKISMVVGAEGTINVMLKTKETYKIPDNGLSVWIEENKNLTFGEKGDMFRFMIYAGKVNNLKLIAGISSMSVTSLETLFKQTTG